MVPLSNDIIAKRRQGSLGIIDAEPADRNESPAVSITNFLTSTLAVFSSEHAKVRMLERITVFEPVAEGTVERDVRGPDDRNRQ